MPRPKKKKTNRQKSVAYINDPKKTLCSGSLFEEIIVYKIQYTYNQYTMICHLIYSYVHQLIHRQVFGVPIPQTAIDNNIPGFKPRHRHILITNGLITCDEDAERHRKCFVWGLGPVLLEKVNRELDRDPGSSKDEKVSTFFSKYGRKPKMQESELTKEPVKIREGMEMLRQNKIDYMALEEKIREQQKRARDCIDIKLQEKLYRKARSSNACYKQITRQNFEYCVNEGIATYTPAYKGSSSGRMFEIGGCMQNMSKEVKAAAYGKFLAKGEMFNYDLRSSQVAILLQLGIKMGLSEESCYPLQRYIDNKQAKKEYAEKAGMPVNLWKRCFLAMLFGASVIHKEGESVYATIKEWTQFHSDAPDLTEEEMGKMLKGFIAAAQPFLEVRKEWFGILRKTLKTTEILTNAVGKEFKGEKRPNLFSAFLLQGLEAAFIQYLMSVSNKYGYEVYSLEHDGILVSEQIPQEAIDEAKEATGFHLAILEEKGFV